MKKIRVRALMRQSTQVGDSLPDTSSKEIESLYESLTGYQDKVDMLNKQLKKQLKVIKNDNEDVDSGFSDLSQNWKDSDLGNVISSFGEFQSFEINKRKELETNLESTVNWFSSSNDNIDVALGEKKKN